MSLGQTDPEIKRLWIDFPKFLLGFLLLAVLANLGLFSNGLEAAISNTSDALFLVAFAGLGFEIRLEEMRETGLGPVVVLGTYLLIVSGLTYLVVAMVFP
jgi:uncharacterized membrane protein YadS